MLPIKIILIFFFFRFSSSLISQSPCHDRKGFEAYKLEEQLAASAIDEKYRPELNYMRKMFSSKMSAANSRAVEGYRPVVSSVECFKIFNETNGSAILRTIKVMTFKIKSLANKKKRLSKAELIFDLNSLHCELNSPQSSDNQPPKNEKKHHDERGLSILKLKTTSCQTTAYLHNFLPTKTIFDGFLSFDVTNLVEECLNDGIKNIKNGVIDIRLQILEFPTEHFGHLPSADIQPPFLIIHNELNDNVASKVSKRLKRDVWAVTQTYAAYEDFAKPKTRKEVGAEENKLEKITPGRYFQYGMVGNEKALWPNEEKTEKNDLSKYQNLEEKSARLRSRPLTRRQNQDKSLKGSRFNDKDDPMMGFGREPWFGRRRHKPRHLRPASRKATQNYSILARNSKTNNEKTTINQWKKENNTEKCTRQSLIVNFKDIGWGGRIIEPNSFDAGYCAGPCQFPLDLKRSTNHAIVLSLLQHSPRSAATTINETPTTKEDTTHMIDRAVCCAPDQMDSLTLLYIDESENIVLKNFPKMSVVSCTCK